METTPQSAAHGQSRPTLHALTGLRGVGALWVVAYHVFPDEWPIVRHGDLGVDLFFILSGFILSYVHANEFQYYDWRRHARFLGLRLARIYPLHVVVLVLFATAVLGLPDFRSVFLHPDRLSWEAFVATFFLVNSWGRHYQGGNWNPPTWSLSAEWLAYLGFPLGVWIVSRIPWRWQCGAIVMVFTSTLAVMTTFAGRHPDSIAGPGLVRMAAEFTTGCLLFAYLGHPRAASLPWKLLGYLACGLIVLSVLVEALIGLAVLSFALLIASSATTAGGVARILGSPPLRVLGEVSFSLYLCHWPLIMVRNWALGHTAIPHAVLHAMLVLAMAGTTFAAWHGVEVPARRWGRRLVTRRVSNSILPVDLRTTAKPCTPSSWTRGHREP